MAEKTLIFEEKQTSCLLSVIRKLNECTNEPDKKIAADFESAAMTEFIIKALIRPAINYYRRRSRRGVRRARPVGGCDLVQQ
jgi:hypothetical protein